MHYILIATILKMSFTGSIAILLVFLTRKILGKSPKIFSYILWLFVLFRLLCPISFQSPVAIVPEMISTGQFVMHMTSEEPEGSFEEYGSDFNGFYMEHETNVNLKVMQIISIIWAIGFTIIVFHSLRSLYKLKKQTACSMLLEDNVYIADYIDSPFVIGLIKPKIYIPSTLSEMELKYVLAHEKHHIKRKDHIVKFVGFIALCLHWFNFFVWYMFETMCIDMEMSCDEAVLKKMGDAVKENYSSTLLHLAGKSRFVSSIPLAFVEGDTKLRIKNILNWKKPTVILASITALICLCSATLALANPIVPDRTIVKTFEQSENTYRYDENYTQIQWYEDFQKSFKDEYATEKELVLHTYHQLADGTWKSYQYYYDNLLILSGKVKNRPVTLYVLSNVDNITFEEACWTCRYVLGQEHIEMPDALKGKDSFLTTHGYGFVDGMHTLVGIKYAD